MSKPVGSVAAQLHLTIGDEEPFLLGRTSLPITIKRAGEGRAYELAINLDELRETVEALFWQSAEGADHE